MFLGVQYYLMGNFNVQQGVAQGCSLSPILFSVIINGLLNRPGSGWK